MRFSHIACKCSLMLLDPTRVPWSCSKVPGVLVGSPSRRWKQYLTLECRFADELDKNASDLLFRLSSGSKLGGCGQTSEKRANSASSDQQPQQPQRQARSASES